MNRHSNNLLHQSFSDPTSAISTTHKQRKRPFQRLRDFLSPLCCIIPPSQQTDDVYSVSKTPAVPEIVLEKSEITPVDNSLKAEEQQPEIENVAVSKCPSSCSLDQSLPGDGQNKNEGEWLFLEEGDLLDEDIGSLTDEDCDTEVDCSSLSSLSDEEEEEGYDGDVEDTTSVDDSDSTSWSEVDLSDDDSHEEITEEEVEGKKEDRYCDSVDINCDANVQAVHLETDSQSLPEAHGLNLDPVAANEDINIASITDYPKIGRDDLVNPVGNTVDHIGRGSTCSVKLMKLRANDFLVAVKQLTPTESRSTLFKEIDVLRKLEHCLVFPQLIGVIDEEQPSLVMEFVGDWHTMTSVTVGDALNSFNPRLSTAQWLAVARDVAQGLASLHGAGFLHGDLHCSNIMLCRYPLFRDPLGRWQAKIIDLGFSESLASPSAPLQLTEKQKDLWRGCYLYKAPELIEGTTGHTIATDTYAFGDVISEIGKICDIEILSSLGRKCMDKDPQQRGDLRVIARELSCQVFRH